MALCGPHTLYVAQYSFVAYRERRPQGIVGDQVGQSRSFSRTKAAVSVIWAPVASKACYQDVRTCIFAEFRRVLVLDWLSE